MSKGMEGLMVRNDDLLTKTKDNIIGTRQAGRMISRRVVIAIGAGVVKVNEPNLLKEYGGPLKLSEDWARYVLKSMEWVKRRALPEKQSLRPPDLLSNLDCCPWKRYPLRLDN